jgi:nucleoside-diphosphate-sugar epimerase
MSAARVLVTGGTGLLGSHLCEQLCAKGTSVRALVRRSSDLAFLRSLGVELFEGDLTDPKSCQAAVRNVAHVFHAAAKVGDWGRWPEFDRDCLQATRTLAESAAREGVDRFVHISSTSAYGHPQEGGPPVEETAALGQRLWWPWDYYTRSKVECERILWGLMRSDGLRLTVIRPSWLFGERDRTTTARIVRRMQGPGVPLVGGGGNPLSAIYAGCVAEAAILASLKPSAAGQAFNITDQGSITQREFFTLWADALGLKAPKRHIPYPLLFWASLAVEAGARLIRRSRPPVITRYATWLMGRNLSYSTEKARRSLGWSAGLSYTKSIERTVEWYRRHTLAVTPSAS